MIEKMKREIRNALPVIWGRIKQDIGQHGAGVLAVVVLYFVMHALFGAFCPSVIVTGFPCPGCGMTRAALLFFKGKWNTAWQMHPFFFVLLVLAAVAAAFRYGAGRSMPGFKRIVPAVLILSILFYVYRMIRYFPGQEPMTYSSHNILRLLADIHG